MATIRNLGACLLLAAGIHAVAFLWVSGQAADVGPPPSRDFEVELDLALPREPKSSPLEVKSPEAERPFSREAKFSRKASLPTAPAPVRAQESTKHDHVPAERPTEDAPALLAGVAREPVAHGVSLASGPPGEGTRGANHHKAQETVSAIEESPRLTRGAHCEDLFSPRTTEQTITFLVRVAPNGNGSLERALGPVDPAVLGGADRCIHRLHFEDPRTSAGPRREDALVKIRLKIRGSRA